MSDIPRVERELISSVGVIEDAVYDLLEQNSPTVGYKCVNEEWFKETEKNGILGCGECPYFEEDDNRSIIESQGDPQYTQEDSYIFCAIKKALIEKGLL